MFTESVIQIRGVKNRVSETGSVIHFQWIYYINNFYRILNEYSVLKSINEIVDK